jgi:hypothetical protein
VLRGFEYSANEKWNLDFNQFLLVQVGLVGSLAGFPNQAGFGSKVKTIEYQMSVLRIRAF